MVSGPDDRSEALAVLTAYKEQIDAAYGAYLDAMVSMRRLHKDFVALQKRGLERHASRPDFPKTMQELDGSPFHYGQGTANEAGSFLLHDTTQGEFKARLVPGGSNGRTLSRLLILSVFHYWEDHYRELFARSIGKQKNDIKAPIFGDIRHLRRSIIHHRNLAIDDVRKCEIIKSFAPGDEIHFDERHCYGMVIEVFRALDGLGSVHTGVDLGFGQHRPAIGFQRFPPDDRDYL